MRSPVAMDRHEYVAPARGVSLLRLSVPQRLAIVAVAVCFLWLAVYWALR
ncbi:MAG TPA: hypothetical protein VMW57_08640 [Methyloceanibacter sp.]|nr:hypothetical protein [Methyloceanibacter sp.]